jgi:hypothetical protein
MRISSAYADEPDMPCGASDHGEDAAIAHRGSA